MRILIQIPVHNRRASVSAAHPPPGSADRTSISMYLLIAASHSAHTTVLRVFSGLFRSISVTIGKKYYRGNTHSHTSITLFQTH